MHPFRLLAAAIVRVSGAACTDGTVQHGRGQYREEQSDFSRGGFGLS